MTQNITIIGAGLSGLTAPVTAAQSGAKVTVGERIRHMGGRAMTTGHEGRLLNFGAHALYVDGPAVRRLRQLNIPVVGQKTPTSGSLVCAGGLTTQLSTAGVILRRAALSAGDRCKFIGLFLGLKKALGTPPEDMVLSEWLEETGAQRRHARRDASTDALGADRPVARGGCRPPARTEPDLRSSYPALRDAGL